MAILEANMRILAVDDEPYILELMPMLAAKFGFNDVTTASSGQLALDAIATVKLPFDCLLLDINMPGMDGIELCRRVRQLAGYRVTPIIMLTAMSEREYIENAFKAGATDYAIKPFDIVELGARLRLAHELVIARCQAEMVKDLQAGSGNSIAQLPVFSLFETIPIDGIKAVIDFASFKNFFKQISRAGLAASHVIAIKVDRIEEFYICATAAEFTYALREVADAINDVLNTSGCLISYGGNGLFLVISSSAAQLSATGIEADVQQLLDEKNLEYDSGAPLDLEVSIGNPVQPSFTDFAEIPESLERAIARAETRSMTKRCLPPAANDFR